ncbi:MULTISPECIES: eCIS core domain-containing protein [unclassified Paenibacillus]|uniref:eCIS core domain-containing protein n=1 Tax=unclassified Paenibacillus TaxID=185978 RepID=UPI003637B69F
MPIHQSRQNGKSSAMANVQRRANAAKSASNAIHSPHNGQQLTAASMMNLQGTIGNRGVQRMISGSQDHSVGSRFPIQTKMAVGPVGDKYEQEADKVASQVVQQLQTKPATDSVQRMEQSEEESEELQMKPAESIQRMELPEEESEELQMKPAVESIQRMELPEEESEELQMKPAAETIQRMELPEEESEELQMKPAAETIQRMELPEEESEELQMKPAAETIQRMELPEEESEELQMKPAAESIQRMELPEEESEELQMKPAAETIQRMELPEEESEELQMKPAAETIQRMELPEEESEELQMKPATDSIQRMELPEEESEELQMKPEAGGGFDVTPSVEQRIQAKSGAGSQMDSKTRSGMEQAMGADFSDVSIHNDAESGKLNEEIGAQAFTQGNDVFFSNGKYDPSSPQGQELLAHELTHVVQQRGK